VETTTELRLGHIRGLIVHGQSATLQNIGAPGLHDTARDRTP